MQQPLYVTEFCSATVSGTWYAVILTELINQLLFNDTVMNVTVWIVRRDCFSSALQQSGTKAVESVAFASLCVITASRKAVEMWTRQKKKAMLRRQSRKCGAHLLSANTAAFRFNYQRHDGRVNYPDCDVKMENLLCGIEVKTIKPSSRKDSCNFYGAQRWHEERVAND